MVVEHLDSRHESSDADAIILGSANFFGLVINGVEFADFVAVTDLFEEGLDGCTVARALEVLLLDSDFGVGRREQQVHSLWLVAVVLEISNRPLLLVRDVHPDCWATERTLPVLLPPQSISTVWFNRLTEVSVWLELTLAGLSCDALTSVPVHVLLHLSIGVVSVPHGLALTKVFDRAKHVCCNGFLVLDNFLNNHCLWETFLDSFGLDRLGSASKESLLAIAEGMGQSIACAIGNPGICIPVVVSLPLLTGSEVSMGLLIHFSSFSFLLQAAPHGIEDIFGRHTDSGWNSE